MNTQRLISRLTPSRANALKAISASLLTLTLAACVRNGYPAQMYACTAEATEQQAAATIGLRFEFGQVYLSGDERIYFGGIGVCPLGSRYEASHDQMYFDTQSCGEAKYRSKDRWIGKFNRLTKHLELTSVNQTANTTSSHWSFVCTKASWDPST